MVAAETAIAPPINGSQVGAVTMTAAPETILNTAPVTEPRTPPFNIPWATKSTVSLRQNIREFLLNDLPDFLILGILAPALQKTNQATDDSTIHDSVVQFE